MRANRLGLFSIGILFPMVVLSLACGGSDAKVSEKSAGVAPSIVTQPKDQSVLAGTHAVFSVEATGTQPLTYQWIVNGEAAVCMECPNCGRWTSPTCTLWGACQPMHGTTFAVKVSNEVGSVTSQTALLNIYATDSAPSIVTQPSNLTVSAGSPAAFSVTAIGSGPLSYNWRRNGVNIEWAGFPGLQLPAVSQSDNGAVFTVEVTSWWGTVTSAPAKLTVN